MSLINFNFTYKQGRNLAKVITKCLLYINIKESNNYLLRAGRGERKRREEDLLKNATDILIKGKLKRIVFKILKTYKIFYFKALMTTDYSYF